MREVVVLAEVAERPPSAELVRFAEVVHSMRSAQRQELCDAVFGRMAEAGDAGDQARRLEVETDYQVAKILGAGVPAPIIPPPPVLTGADAALVALGLAALGDRHIDRPDVLALILRTAGRLGISGFMTRTAKRWTGTEGGAL